METTAKSNSKIEKGSDYPADKQELSDVSEIIILLSKAISTIKIFQSEHATVKKHINKLWEKMNEFLEKNPMLEIEIQELSFSYKNKKIFQDKKTIRSLPFLFYKDGMQKLTFYKGLKKEELQEFMGIIKKVYDQPTEESDVVNLLWEKDFANIRYFAPDEFLETKIGIGKKISELQVNRDALFSGHIELFPEDRAELDIATSQEPDTLELEVSDGVGNEEQWEVLEFEDQTATLTMQENRILDAMLTANRQVMPEDELVLLTTEMLNLEEDSERFKEILGAITHIHNDLIQKGDFGRTHQLLSNALEIKMFSSYKSQIKEKLVNSFLLKLRNRETIDLIKKSLLEKKLTDFRLFFAYLDLLLGTEAFPIIAELFEKMKDPQFRELALDFLREKAKIEPEALIQIADDERGTLTKEVISILGSIPDKRSIQSFANFIHYKDKGIKAEAIKVLGESKNITSSKILLGFLNDPDENLRVLAAQSIQYPKDDSLVEQIRNIVISKAFMNKNKDEKQAILDILSRSKTKRAYECLGMILNKARFYSRPKKIETAICTIQALKAMGSPESRRILKLSIQSRNKKVKEAAGQALRNISLNPSQERQEDD
jgi:HEAT repeat protein